MSSGSKRRTQFPSSSLVTNMKVAKTQVVYSPNVIILQAANDLASWPSGSVSDYGTRGMGGHLFL